MNKLCIISCDKLFIRMLELELTPLFSDIKLVTEKLNTPALKLISEPTDLVVFDADYFSGDLSFVKQTEKTFVLFSKSQADVLPDNVTAFFERPFVISDFIKHIADITRSDKADVSVSAPISDINIIELDPFSKQAIIGGKTVRFSPKEFSLLSLLYKNRGKTVSRQEVINTVWGKDYDTKNNVDNVYINYLRKKLDDRFGVKMIYTIRGKGYMMK